MSVVHVYPIDDIVSHILQGDGCLCSPSVETVEGGAVVVHNSWDDRELLEEVEEILEGQGGSYDP